MSITKLEFSTILMKTALNTIKDKGEYPRFRKWFTRWQIQYSKTIGRHIFYPQNNASNDVGLQTLLFYSSDIINSFFWDDDRYWVSLYRDVYDNVILKANDLIVERKTKINDVTSTDYNNLYDHIVEKMKAFNKKN